MDFGIADYGERTSREQAAQVAIALLANTASRTPSRMVARPPEFGEQTDEVLKEFGFGGDEIAQLRAAKVV